MRARGAKVTDIAILVVAADDGVMPQTIEALNHAQAADVPIVVAVNKIDKEGANPAKVRQQLTEYNLVAEEYGGDTMFVDVSAKQGTNIDAAARGGPAHRRRRARPAGQRRQGRPRCRDRGPPRQGPRCRSRPCWSSPARCAVGDSIVAGTAYGRVRAMLDEHGEHGQRGGPVASGPGARPDLGARRRRHVPRGAGRPHRPPDRREARGGRACRRRWPRRRKRISLEDFTQALAAGQGRDPQPHPQGRRVRCSVEALEDALLKIDVGEEVELRIIDRGVGAITQNDVNLAIASTRDHHRLQRPVRGAGRGAGRPRGRRRPLLLGHLPGHRGDRGGPQGHAQAGVRGGAARHRRGPRGLPVLASSATSPARSSASARSAATPRRGSSRDGAVVGGQPRDRRRCARFKDDATEVREGFECGIGLGSFNDIKIGDIIETYEMREKPRA